MHITIIGLGGVGSQVARQLALSHSLHLIDFDKYETRNAFRQPIAKLHINEYKSAAHAEYLQDGIFKDSEKEPHTYSIEGIQSDSKIPPTDMVICAVDNNSARNATREICIKTETPLIIAANEQFDGEASILLPNWVKTKLDPWETWPQLYDESPTEDDNKPIHCTDPRIATLEPQTPLANFMAAAGAVWLAEKFVAVNGKIEFFDPIRMSFTINTLRSKRPYDLIQEEEWKGLQCH